MKKCCLTYFFKNGYNKIIINSRMKLYVKRI